MRGRRYAALLVVMLLSAACSGGGGEDVEAPKGSGTLTVTSLAFDDGGEIPEQFSCDGNNAPPPLSWERTEAVEYAITMVDPDADGFVHWIVFGIKGRGAMALTSLQLSSIGVPGENSTGGRGYTGPCPPEGDDPHTYEITVYALDDDVSSSLDEGASIDDFIDAIECCVTAEGTLSGTFGR